MVVLSLFCSAFALDVFPGWGQPSAVPMTDGKTVAAEVAVGGSRHGTTVGQSVMSSLSVAWSPSRAIRLGVHGYGLAGDQCSLFGGCSKQGRFDATVDVTGTLYATDTTRLALTASVGSSLQAGLAYWGQSDNPHWTVDATWQPGIHTDLYGVATPTWLPEIGATWSPDLEQLFVRVGTASFGLNASVRYVQGSMALEGLLGLDALAGASARVAMSAAW